MAQATPYVLTPLNVQFGPHDEATLVREIAEHSANSSDFFLHKRYLFWVSPFFDMISI